MYPGDRVPELWVERVRCRTTQAVRSGSVSTAASGLVNILNSFQTLSAMRRLRRGVVSFFAPSFGVSRSKFEIEIEIGRCILAVLHLQALAKSVQSSSTCLSGSEET